MRSKTVFCKTAAIALVVVLAALPQSGFAQVCLGQRPFSDAPTHVSINNRWLQDSRGPEARLAFGIRQIFVGAGAGVLSIGGTNRVYSVTGEAGTSIDVGSRLSVCPIASFTHQPESRENRTYPTTRELRFGGSAGTTVPLSATLNLLPYFGAGYLRTTYTFEQSSTATRDDLPASTGTELFGGVGLQINQQFIVRAGGRYRDGYGRRARTVLVGVTLAPSRR